MNELTTTIREAMEDAAISGLCREGQLELAAQAVRRKYPDLSDEALVELIEAESGR